MTEPTDQTWHSPACVCLTRTKTQCTRAATHQAKDRRSGDVLAVCSQHASSLRWTHDIAEYPTAKGSEHE